MSERPASPLIVEIARAKSLMTLSPEDRQTEVRRRMYVELREMEIERRQRAAQEMEKSEKDREVRVRQEAEQREDEKAEQLQLKQERLRWEKVMQVEAELVKRPRTINPLKKEQQRRREEAERCRHPKVGDKAGPERLASDLKADQQSGPTTLRNNWVGAQKPVSESVEDKLHPDSSTYLLFAVKPAPKPAEQTKPPKTKTLSWLKEKVGSCVEKYQDHSERKNEQRKLKAEAQYARWTAIKASRASSFSEQFDCYTRSAVNRNSIVKYNN